VELSEPRIYVGEALVHPCVDIGEAFAHGRFSLGETPVHQRSKLSEALVGRSGGFGKALLHLRVESSEVEFIQFPQFASVIEVHGVQQLHEFVGDGIAEAFVEFAGQLGGDGHADLVGLTKVTLRVPSATGAINPSLVAAFVCLNVVERSFHHDIGGGVSVARALVIGGTLLIGRALVEQLLERGDDVVIMHRGAGTPFGSRVKEIACDRNDIAAVRAGLDGQHFDVIYDNVFDWKQGTSAEQVCAAATANVQGLRRYVFTSSVAVYAPGNVERTEAAALVPSDDPNGYGAKKADSERALFALCKDRGIPVSTIRPAFIYGPNNPFDRESFFWDRLMAGRPILVPEDGRTTMQWVHAGDVARASILASEKEIAIGHAYNVANYPPITHDDFVRTLARVAGKTANLVHVPRERLLQLGGGLAQLPYYFGAYLDLHSLTVKADRVRAELGFEFTPFEAGLRGTFAWYEQRDRPQPDYTWEDKVLGAA
jgi:2'-hydroxyisoflavone reductase